MCGIPSPDVETDHPDHQGTV
jgi:hypothetical protein